MSDIDLRLGRWQDVLADVTCDALICDPPYSARTHAGHDEASASANAGDSGESARRTIGYAYWTREDVESFVSHAGGATTLLAAAIEGRRAVGSEMDPVTHAKATKRLARGYTPVMFQTEREPIDPKSQETLFDGEDGG